MKTTNQRSLFNFKSINIVHAINSDGNWLTVDYRLLFHHAVIWINRIRRITKPCYLFDSSRPHQLQPHQPGINKSLLQVVQMLQLTSSLTRSLSFVLTTIDSTRRTMTYYEIGFFIISLGIHNPSSWREFFSSDGHKLSESGRHNSAKVLKVTVENDIVRASGTTALLFEEPYPVFHGKSQLSDCHWLH